LNVRKAYTSGFKQLTSKKEDIPFKEAIKDGVLLCNLMSSISPGKYSNSDIHPAGSPQGLLRDNIEMFIDYCKELGFTDKGTKLLAR
jgi:hypothetical protein